MWWSIIQSVYTSLNLSKLLLYTCSNANGIVYVKVNVTRIYISVAMTDNQKAN